MDNVEQAHLDHLDNLSGVNTPKLKEPIEAGHCMLCGEFIEPGTGATSDAHIDCI